MDVQLLLADNESGSDDNSDGDNHTVERGGVQIAYMAGTIGATEQRTFEKLIFRLSRGKVLTRFHE